MSCRQWHVAREEKGDWLVFLHGEIRWCQNQKITSRVTNSQVVNKATWTNQVIHMRLLTYCSMYKSHKHNPSTQSQELRAAYSALKLQCSCTNGIENTNRVGDVVGDAPAEDGRGEPRVHVLRVQILVLAVEEQRSSITAQQVCECLANHSETEHRSILRERINKKPIYLK